MKVLHIVESLDRGAVETWLIRMLNHANNKRVDVDWTFYCALGQAGAMDDQAESLGARVVHSPVPIGKKLQFMRALRAEMRRGKYDVIHCHHDLVSAVYFLASIGIPVERRIVHVHNADESVLTPSRLKQSVIRGPMRLTCLIGADRVVAISKHTLATFLAGRVPRPGRDIVHYYGLDTASSIASRLDRKEFRSQLGLREDTPILLFAGRLVHEKNPIFTVDVLVELLRIEPDVVAVFAGTGALAPVILAKAREFGVESAVRFLGWRSDIPAVMKCCDWFILPRPEHPMEGFGIAVVEAQLAGLRMLLSKGIADDPLLPTAKFRRLALSDGPKAWAAAAVALRNGAAPSPAAAVEALKDSPMDMSRAFNALMELYT